MKSTRYYSRVTPGRSAALSTTLTARRVHSRHFRACHSQACHSPACPYHDCPVRTCRSEAFWGSLRHRLACIAATLLLLLSTATLATARIPISAETDTLSTVPDVLKAAEGALPETPDVPGNSPDTLPVTPDTMETEQDTLPAPPDLLQNVPDTVAASPDDLADEPFTDEAVRRITEAAGDPFLGGLALRDSLGIIAALDFWESVFREWKEAGRHDPRIGFRFVEYAVEAGDPGRYAAATEIHSWGLRGSFEELYREEIRLEMLMMEPLMDRRDFREWNRLYENRDSRLLREMNDFWSRNNMVPSSDRNERLIEHWQRIHFSREHFTNDTNTVYGADDRALIYVRLGAPDRQRSGTLSYNTAELRNRLYDLVEAGVINVGQVYILQMNIMQNYSPGSYDFWRYDRISDQGPVIYLFGRPGREGRYRLLDSVEDFISGSGYRSVVIGRRGTPSAFRAGYFLQMMLYNEVSTLDNYFGMRFMEYERRWNQAIFHSGANARMLGDLLSPKLAAHDMQLVRARAPQSQSLFERNLVSYPLMHRQFRFIDEEAGPVTYVLMHPSPQLHQLTDMLDQQPGIHVAGYVLRQGFLVYADGERTKRYIDEHVSEIREIDTAPGAFYTSTQFPADERETRIQLFSELYLRPGSVVADVLGRSLVGVSREWVTSEEPLRNDGQLLISDLVLGSTGNQPIGIRSGRMGLLSGYEINPDDDLQVYFEVYNLQPGQNGEHRYSIAYRLKSEGRRRLLLFRSRSPEVSLSWEASAPESRDFQFFEVDLSHAQNGNYTLEITVTDSETDETYLRSVDLTLKSR